MERMVSVILLLFVAVSVVYLIIGETRKPSAATPTPVAIDPAAIPAEQPAGEIGERATSEPLPGARTVVYYFHGTMRCPTCLRIERYAREAVEEAFAAELDAGLVEWQSVNYDEPANEHFMQDYGLVASALVLVSMDSGTMRGWRNLERIWDLSDDEYEFKGYVVDEATLMLRGGP